MKKLKHSVTAALCVIALGLLSVGCGTEDGTGPVDNAHALWKVSFDLSSPAVTDAGGTRPENQSGLGEGGPDSVTILGGAAMIRSVRFESNTGTSVDTNITAEDEGRDLADPDITLQGPYVLTVNGSVQNLGTDDVEAGTYSQVVFVLQPARVTDDLNGHDELIGKSISVTGLIWHNGVGQRFTYSTDYSSEFAVGGNFELSAGVTDIFELSFDAGQWFRVAQLWLDPTDPANSGTIIDNIRRNIHAGEGVTGE